MTIRTIMTVLMTCDLCEKEFKMEGALSRRGGFREPDRTFVVDSPTGVIDYDVDTICDECEAALLDALKVAMKKLKDPQRVTTRKRG